MKKKNPKEEVVAESSVGDEVIAIAPEGIQAHLQQGKAHFEAARYAEALKEFEAILKTAPGNIETRVWIRKVKEELAEPKIETVAEREIKRKECVWMKLGMVSYRLCNRNYDCLACEFDQKVQEKMTGGDAPELESALEEFKKLPANQRVCRYVLKGYISYRLCTSLFQCSTCEFAQMVGDALHQKLAKLAARRKALGKK